MDETQKKLLETLDNLSPYFEELILLLKNVKELSTGIKEAGDDFAEKIKGVTAEIIIPQSVSVKEVNVDIIKFREMIRDITDQLEKTVRENIIKEVTIKDPESIKPNISIKLDHLKEVEELLTKLIAAQKTDLKITSLPDVKISNTDPKDAIPARLVTKNGKDFYESMARIISSGGSGGGAEKVYAVQVKTDSIDTNVQYVGEAEVGTPTSSPAWRIRKVNKNTGTVVTWAGGTAEFNKIYDNRQSLSYS